MYKQVLIMYHLETRDRKLFEMMADQIRESGISENVILRNMEDVYRYPYDYSPDLVVSPLPRNNRGSAMFTLLKVLYQCYWIGYTVETFFSLEQENIWLIGNASCPRELIDKYLFCGSGIASTAGDALLRSGRTDSLDRVNYFGYLFYEKNVISKINNSFVDEANVYNNLDKYKKRILFVTGIMNYPMLVEDYLGESAITKKQPELIQELKELCESNNYYSDKYIELIYYLAKKHPEYMIMIKYHPNDNDFNSHGGESRYKNFSNYSNIYPISGGVQVSNYFSAADVFIHYASTTSMEAYIYGLKSIGLTSNHPCMKPHGLGKEAMYANKILEVEDVEGIEKEIESGLDFSRNEQMEQALFDLVNYEYGKEYSPSKKLVDILRNIEKPQFIDKSNKDVKKKLKYKSNIKKYAEYISDALICLLRGELKKCKRIMKTIGSVL